MTEVKTKEPSTRVSMAQQIVRWIKEGLVQNERDRQSGKSGGPHASRGRFAAREVGGCNLRTYFRRLGFPETELERYGPIDLARRGEFLELIVLDALGSSDAKLSSRQEKCIKSFGGGSGEVTVAGRVDALLETGRGVEVKSVGAEEFAELRSIAKVYQSRPSHVRQCLVYCEAFDQPSWFLLYISRDAAKYRCFEIKRDKKLWAKLLEELRAAEEAIKTKTPPDPKPSLGCYFCEYRDNYCPAFGGDPSAPERVPANSGEEVRIPTT